MRFQFSICNVLFPIEAWRPNRNWKCRSVYFGSFFVLIRTASPVTIVFLTVTIRAAMIPLFRKQIKSMRNMQVLQPQIQALQKKHKLDKQLYWYFDGALTLNHGNAHYDLGAGGRALTTDCHDGTHAILIDYSSAGNTTWGGCRIMGFSTGLNYKF